MYIRELLSIALIALPLLAGAQTEDFRRLLAVKSLRCDLGPGTLTTWDSGAPQSRSDKYSGPFQLDSIDPKSGTARLISNDAATDVSVTLSGVGLTFVEQTTIGNLSITTVFADRTKGTNNFIAVQSRHLHGLSGPFPSQFHGTCKVLQ